MNSKFWQVKNEVNGSGEILLYGPIAGSKSWLNDSATHKQFAQDLESLGGKDVTVRINSGGGDVFAAHAIHNQLASYKGKVTIIIDGLAASAATIVAMAGDEIIMPVNAMMMIHNPAVMLDGMNTAAELSSIASALDKIKGSIVAAYLKRCKVSSEELAVMMDAETWMGAAECLDKGFVDTIEGSAQVVLNDNMLIVNSMQYNISNFKNLTGLKNQFRNETEVTNKMTKLEMILNKLGLLEDMPADEATNVLPVSNSQPGITAEQAVAAERQRIADLEALDCCDNAAVNAIINTAKKDGRTANDVKVYIDAVKNAPAAPAAAQNVVADMVNDSKDSGVDGVGAVPADKDDNAAEKAADAAAMDYMVGVINNKIGGKK